MKLWIFLALVSVNFACVAKVKIDIYYESLCPDSIAFINQQLAPLYNDFKKHLDVTFVPFGKSNSFQTSPESPIEFECQHGPDECFGNKVQGCMLARIPDQDSKFDYVSCQMVTGADRTHRQCVESFGMSWDEIVQCAESDFATNQQLEYERISTPVIQHFNWVPTVVYNGQITDISHTRNAPPLREIICDFIHNTNPACASRRR